ncbi:MAG: type II toxin-antitoxin system HicB family antitoxin [Planctomycetota bacterium]
MERYQFQAIVEQDEDGVYVAEIPAVKACYAQGKSFEESVANLTDVLRMCLEEMRSRGEDIPPPAEVVGFKRVEVTV